MADSDFHKFEEKDIFVLGTNGVFDNLFPQDICEIIQSNVDTDKSLKNIENVANEIAEAAKTKS